MDPNPLRPMRGRARGRPQIPAANQQGSIPPRPQFAQSRITVQPIQQQMQQLGMNRPPRSSMPSRSMPPRSMPPRPSGMPPRVPRPLVPRPLVPRPLVPRLSIGDPSSSVSVSKINQPIEQVTEGLKPLTEGDELVPIGRGAIRGRRQIDITDDHFRSPRPLSSMGASGKQGTTGQPVQLLANYFPVTSYTNWCLYQYRVDFDPEEDRIGTKRGLVAQHKERLGGYLFDGTMLFSGNRYDPEIFNLTSIRRCDDQKVVITVRFTSIIETGDYVYIQVFNLLLRNCLRHLDLKLIGRNFYDANAKINIPQHKLQLWPGYETTIGRYESSILLCAEISTKVMRQETVLDFLNQCYNERNRGENWNDIFKSGVVGTVVMTLYNNETYRIDDVDDESTPASEFSKKDGTKMTYMQYYKEKWGLTIRVNKQPMLISKNRKSLRRFGEESLVYLVPELCMMTGITEVMRNNFTLMKDMAIYTRVNPDQRIKRLTSFANRLLQSPESVAELNKWNLKLSNSLVDVPGRILPVEKIGCNSSVYDAGMEGDWTRHLRSLPMYTCAIMKSWVILIPSDNVRDLQGFTHSLQKAAQGMSFTLPQPKIYPMRDGRGHTFVTAIEEVINSSNPNLILCVVPSSRGDIYSLIKRKLCIDRAVPSQVVLLKNVQKNNLSVCTKIAIQLNCKIGGAPWIVSIPKKGMMIVGFDVCHDIQRKNLSYGALVATMNDSHSSYYSCVEPHESGEELSNHFAASIAKALIKYRKKNGSYPTSIVVYRDGVGDGQISHVQQTEVELLKTACSQLYGPTSVPFAFVIVTKRINTRFFANCKQNPQNPQPGTVIDSVVTDPTKYDFYLVSQHVRQGTVTPTHYQVIEDTLLLPPDIMQRLTYKLTHMYYNWSGTVRVPAPCQLAHKLAFLTGQTLRSPPNTGLDELLYFL